MMDAQELKDISVVIKKTALAVQERGGRLLIVGGAVRDELLHKEPFDYDMEVYHIARESLKDLLKAYGELDEKGGTYGIIHLKKTSLDFALPRKERLIGKGHRDFKVIVDPDLTYAEASQRRDFTINALMKDPLTNEVLDFHGGLQDLKNRTIRHIIAESFIEDPLRALRAARLASQLDFTIARETLSLCSRMDLTTLSPFRIQEEVDKALMSERPELFFDALKDMDQLKAVFEDLIYDQKVHNLFAQSPFYRNQADDPLNFMRSLLSLMNKRSTFPLTAKKDIGKVLQVCATYDLLSKDIQDQTLRDAVLLKRLIDTIR